MVWMCSKNDLNTDSESAKVAVFRVGLQKVVPMPGATDETFSVVYNSLQIYMYYSIR